MTVTRLGEAQPHNPVTVLRGSGLRVNQLILGVGPFAKQPDEQQTNELYDSYRAAGGATFDVSGDGGTTAAEHFAPWLAGQDRDDVVLLGRSGRARSSLGAMDGSKRALIASLDHTLNALRVEHLDVWLIDGLDLATPTREVVEAMKWALDSGRASYVGVARAAAWQCVDLAHQLRQVGAYLSVASNTASLLDRHFEHDLADASRALGFAQIGARPLAAGALSGKYRHGTPADSRLTTPFSADVRPYLGAQHRPVIESVATAADGLGVHPSEVALAWAMAHPDLEALTFGARNAAQLKVNLRASELNLPQEIMTALDDVASGTVMREG